MNAVSIVKRDEADGFAIGGGSSDIGGGSGDITQGHMEGMGINGGGSSCINGGGSSFINGGGSGC